MIGVRIKTPWSKKEDKKHTLCGFRDFNTAPTKGTFASKKQEKAKKKRKIKQENTIEKF